MAKCVFYSMQKDIDIDMSPPRIVDIQPLLTVMKKQQQGFLTSRNGLGYSIYDSIISAIESLPIISS